MRVTSRFLGSTIVASFMDKLDRHTATHADRSETGVPRPSHPTLYFRISSAPTSLLMPGSSGAGTSPSIILMGPPVSK